MRSGWAIAEEAGHEGPHRMQALLGSYRWDWGRLRGELAGLATAWLPCDPGDLIGPGVAIDETAQLKHILRFADVSSKVRRLQRRLVSRH